jgi:hypothetical protein
LPCTLLSQGWNSLDSELWRSGDVDAVQQIPKSAGGDRGFISKSFDLIDVMECLVLLGVPPRSVVFTFSLVALFFFFLIVFFPLLVMVIVLRHMLSFLHVFPCRYCDHNLKGVLP